MTVGPSLTTALLVGGGGTLGALSRFGVDSLLDGTRGVFVVNVLGSVALGALVAAPVDSALVLVFGTGFCGAFTTFSSFAVGVVERAQSGERVVAVRDALVMLVAALVGVALGGGVVGLLG
jgi:CrcB protein